MNQPSSSAPIPPGLAPKLILQVPGGTRLEVPLTQDVLSIGRAPENDIVVDHDSISPRHAQVMLQGRDVVIQDLGSEHGTFVRGERLETGYFVTLPPGEQCYLGQVPAAVGEIRAPVMGAQVASAPVAIPTEPGRTLAGETIPGQPPAGADDRGSGRRTALILAILAGGALLLLVFLLVGGAAIGIRLLRQGGERALAACVQPPMALTLQGGVYYDNRLAQNAVAAGAPKEGGEGIISPRLPGGGQAILSTAFLEIPFPYDGGNVNFGGTFEQFKLASQRNTGTGGRINSYFDHYLPLYPAPKDPGLPGGNESAEMPIAQNILTFDGLLNPYFSYSGHPAVDYSTFEYRQPTTPVFAAADGVVFAVGTHASSGALFVRIKHTVQGVGDFLTIYWHLNPDEYFDAMLGTEGQFIRAGTRIGTMGNTGYSTGHHLHFEVRFDQNGDGVFSGSEVVDPYGFIPSVQYPDDPWYTLTKSYSSYLWVHSLGGAATVGADGGGTLPTMGGSGGAFGDDPAAPGGTTAQPPICAQPGTFPAGSQVFYSWAPDPAPNETTAGTGNGCVLSVLDPQGNPLSQFEKPVTVVVPFNDSDLTNIDPDTLKIYWRAVGSDTWEPLETTLDFDQRIAVAETDRPGQCSLMGAPTQDFLPPTTVVQISGAKAQDGSLYKTVTVSLTSSDASGVKETYYSLDYGTTWELYTGPFEVQPNGIPQPTLMDEEFFGAGPGTFMVLAYSVDAAGNVEDPPRSDYFSIDPSKDPQATAAPLFTATPTRTPTSLFTPTATATATSTPNTCELTFTLSKNANCRKGPGTVYDVFTSYLAGETYPIIGRSEGEVDSLTWFQVQTPDAVCWLSAAVGIVNDAAGSVPLDTAACVKTVQAPPTPTPKPPDTTPPTAPTAISPVDSDLACTTQVELKWTEVKDPSGIDRYEWTLQKINDGVVEGTSGGSVEGTSVIVNVECGYQYRWSVRAVDGAGNAGPYSTPAIFYILSD